MRMETAPLGDKPLPSAGKLDTWPHPPASIMTTLTAPAALRQNHFNPPTRLTPTQGT